MFVIPFLVIATLQLAHDAIDRAWGPLVRSHHERGIWTARVGDRSISGDWKITSTEKSYNPRVRQATLETWVHYVDSRGTGYCAVSLENPKAMFCSTTQTPANIRETVAPIEPLLAEELQLYRLIHKQSLEEQLGVALPEKLATPALTIRLPYRIEVTGSRVPWSDAATTGYDHMLDGYEAEIVIGPRASDVAIKGATLTGRVAERCSYPAATSCSFPLPTCVLR